MSTDAGTVASVVSLLLNNTCSGVSLTLLRVTVSVAFPPFSKMAPRLLSMERVTRSLGCTANEPEPLS